MRDDSTRFLPTTARDRLLASPDLRDRTALIQYTPAMLVLRVLPPTGNPNNLFPYQGIWGLEPVSVPGRIGCTYDARASGRPPLVKSVQVRIVRIESIKGKTVRERMAEAVIWTPPQGSKDAVEIGQVEIPFQLSLPANVRGMSSMTMFPTARVAYHVEASASIHSAFLQKLAHL